MNVFFLRYTAYISNETIPRVRRWRPDNDLVKSAKHFGTVNVAGQRGKRFGADVIGRLPVLVVRDHVVVQHVVRVIAVSVAGGQ